MTIGVPKDFAGAPQFSELVTDQRLDHDRRSGGHTLGTKNVDMNCPFLLLSADCDHGPENTYVWVSLACEIAMGLRSPLTVGIRQPDSTLGLIRSFISHREAGITSGGVWERTVAEGLVQSRLKEARRARTESDVRIWNASTT